MDRLVSDLPYLIDGFQVLGLERNPDIGSEERPDPVAQVRVGGTSRTLVIDTKSKGEPRYDKMAITLRAYRDALVLVRDPGLHVWEEEGGPRGRKADDTHIRSPPGVWCI